MRIYPSFVEPVKHVIIRSNDPFKSADVLLQLLADQNKVGIRQIEKYSISNALLVVLRSKGDLNYTCTFVCFQYPKRYKLVEGEFTHTAIMLLGRQKYQGTGYSPKAARRQVDYYALQQTSYNFVSMPPGVIPGNAVSLSSILTICVSFQHDVRVRFCSNFKWFLYQLPSKDLLYIFCNVYCLIPACHQRRRGTINYEQCSGRRANVVPDLA